MELKQKPTQRTNQQNKSLHKYCSEVADTLNESGISVLVFFQGLEVDFTAEMIKSIIRRIGKVKYGKDSTANLNTIELTVCWEEFNRHLANKTGLHIPWPSKENNDE